MSYETQISSLVWSPPVFVGIIDGGSYYVPVQLNTPDDMWTVTKQSDGTFQFQISNLDYTGVYDGTVAAGNSPRLDVKWRATKQPSCGNDAYTIVLDSNPTVGWKVSNPSDISSKIVTGTIDVSQCDPSQLFTGTFN